MLFLQYIFAFSCLAVFYNYIGYAIILYFINAFKKKKKAYTDEHYRPTVSFIVAAYNEEDCLEKKIINSLQQNYPADKIEFIFITDGSTDATNDIIKNYNQVQLLYKPERNGKSAALNRAVGIASHEILIFSDANTILNASATQNIARHYQNKKIGGVAGEKKVISSSGASDEVGSGEGLYWKYESFLKKIDSEFYSVVGAAGELFSLRRELYEPVANNVILDDFIISMKTAQKGYRIIYEPDAFAMELPSFSIEDEQKRKVRIAAGGFQALVMLASLLKFWKQPRLSFLYISHRVLRWTLSPLSLILAFISNAILFFTTAFIWLKVFFILQLCLYLMAFIGNSSRLKITRLAYYFVFMNLSVIQGFFRFLKGKQPAAWEKVKRNQAV